MSANPRNDQRAFLAVLLAMGVLLVWNLLFPPPPPKPQEAAVSETEELAQESELQNETPSSGVNSPSGNSLGVPVRPEGSETSLLGNTSQSRAFLTQPGVGDPSSPGQQVTVQGENVLYVFESRGARLIRAELADFEEADGVAVQLLPEEGTGALGSMLVAGGQTISLDRFVFDLIRDSSTPNGREIVFQLELDEVTVRKSFLIPPEGHLIQVSQELLVDRVGLEAWGLSWAGGLRSTEERAQSTRGAYFHGSVFAEGKVQRKDPNHARKAPLEFPGLTRFVAIHNKYFLGAIVPRDESQGPSRLWVAPSSGDEEHGLAGEILVERVAGVASNRVDYDVYVGPMDYANLSTLGLGIENVVDLGASWIRPLSRGILSLLIWMHGIIPNYGVVIVLFSTLMNLAFFPLTFKSTKSMRDMAELKPRLDALKEKHKDEPEKMSKATMALYKEAGVNPLAGCMPLLLQMPIFFALYAVLFHTIELRQEPFFAWIRDLSQPDVIFNLPFPLPFIGTGIAALPIIMGITSYLQSKQTMVDPNQKAMVVMMPIMMTFIFFTMPSGLVLYWLTSNLFTIGQRFLLKPSPIAAQAAAVEVDPPKKKSKKSKNAEKAAS